MKWLAIFAFMLINLSAFSQTGELDSTNKTHGLFQLEFNTNAIYLGRKDSLPTPYLSPTIGYYHKSGAFIEGSLSYLTRSTDARVDGGSLRAGYDFSVGNFTGEAAAEKNFYNSNSTNVKSEIKASLSFMADYLAEPHEEYICFSNYPIGDKIADFVVLTSRSKMKVCIVEVKGADFKIVKANHYQGLNVHMNDAITQLKNHMEYINRNYSSFRTQIHEDKDKAINEEYSGNYLVGPRKTLLVDPQKDIDVKHIAIGGVEREDKSIEESHEIVKCKPADNLEIASWNSFVRKLDEYHGHHPVQ